MAKTVLEPTPFPEGGIDVASDTGYSTMTTGAGEGATVKYAANLLLAVKHTAATVVTFKVPQPATYAAKGSTVSDATLNVGANGIQFYPLSAIFRDANDEIQIEFDVAAMARVFAK